MTKKVIIIGSGIAGLQAANELVENYKFNKMDILILEARNRIGGRVCTENHFNTKYDIGGAWLHGLVDHPLIDMIKKHQIDIKRISQRNPWLHPESATFAIYDQRAAYTKVEMEQGWDLHNEIMKQLNALALNSDEDKLSSSIEPIVHEILQTYNESKALCVAKLGLWLIECWMGSSIHDLQLVEFQNIDLMGDNPGEHAVVSKGMGQFVDILGKELDVRLNVQVTSVDYSNEQVMVKAVDGQEYYASKVLVTVPLGVLQKNTIRFVPGLPAEKMGAIQRSKMGSYKKIVLEFPTNFWSTNTSFIGQTWQGKHRTVQYPLFYDLSVIKGINALETVCVGALIEKVIGLSDTDIILSVMLELRAIFGDDIPEPMSHLVTRWEEDPFSYGAYSYLSVESSMDDPELLAKDVDNRVFFAGEATDMDFQGSLQGAYYSGVRAGKEIFNSYSTS